MDANAFPKRKCICGHLRHSRLCDTIVRRTVHACFMPSGKPPWPVSRETERSGRQKAHCSKPERSDGKFGLSARAAKRFPCEAGTAAAFFAYFLSLEKESRSGARGRIAPLQGAKSETCAPPLRPHARKASSMCSRRNVLPSGTSVMMSKRVSPCQSCWRT